MSDSSEMVVYVKTGCPWCHQALDYLNREGFTFETVNVLEDRAAYAEMQELSGQKKTPTMTYGDLLLADFGLDELIPFLEKHGIQP